MTSFTSTSLAACAIATTHLLPVNANKRDTMIQVRTGICAGEPVEETIDYSALPCCRLHDSAMTLRPNQILVAPVVKEICMGKGFTFLDRGETRSRASINPNGSLRWIGKRAEERTHQSKYERGGNDAYICRPAGKSTFGRGRIAYRDGEAAARGSEGRVRIT